MSICLSLFPSLTLSLPPPLISHISTGSRLCELCAKGLHCLLTLFSVKYWLWFLTVFLLSVFSFSVYLSSCWFESESKTLPAVTNWGSQSVRTDLLCGWKPQTNLNWCPYCIIIEKQSWFICHLLRENQKYFQTLVFRGLLSGLGG